MANHAHVMTKGNMTADKVTKLLNQLNVRRFNGNLIIEYSNNVGNKDAWGPHSWYLSYKSPIDNQEYGSRICWLNTRRHFEIRHGGGEDFIWWIDSVITNEIASVFEGRTWDDAFGEEEMIEPQKDYPNFSEYIGEKITGGSEDKIKGWINLIYLASPPEVRPASLEGMDYDTYFEKFFKVVK
jgi:hypothetical protein